jgi:hypothetical protein
VALPNWTKVQVDGSRVTVPDPFIGLLPTIAIASLGRQHKIMVRVAGEGIDNTMVERTPEELVHVFAGPDFCARGWLRVLAELQHLSRINRLKWGTFFP